MVRRDGAPLSAATERQTRRVLKAALAAAMEIELVSRNAGVVGSRVAGEDDEVDIPGPAEIAGILEDLRGKPIYPIVIVALATGARRGEVLALKWSDVDMGAGTITILRTLERTKAHGLRFKRPKTKYSRRTVSVPLETIVVLKEHRRQDLELRMRLGIGRPAPDALIFSTVEGQPLRPDAVSEAWKAAVQGRWRFHSLRHAHASALIAAGVDIVTISR